MAGRGRWGVGAGTPGWETPAPSVVPLAALATCAVMWTRLGRSGSEMQHQLLLPLMRGGWTQVN